MYGIDYEIPVYVAPARLNDRSEDMRRMYTAGTTLAEIGHKYGLTRERVRQILTKRYGIRGADGGHRERSRKREAIRIAKQDARSQKIWGCSYNNYRMLVKHPDNPTRWYSYARRNWQTIVGPDGPQSDISLWQWWQIWQNSGCWELRGVGSGYQMCRIDTTKGFTLDNVHIITGTERAYNAHNGLRWEPTNSQPRHWFSVL